VGQLLLVRHGQASWDAEDYDVLSEKGWEQSRLLGRALAARGIRPDLVVTGGMRRHRETAQACLDELAAALDLPAPVGTEVDPGWDEFDHVSMLGKLAAPFEGREPTKAEFQAWFESAIERWTQGEYDDEYDEPFGEFTGRVDEALRRTTDAAGAGTAIVFSSGGPISWAAASLLSDDDEAAARLWHRLNPVCVNSGVTRLVTGRRGTTLVSFNGHAHLDGVPGALTYR
jgi:broad specificity phosphatase PhoE